MSVGKNEIDSAERFYSSEVTGFDSLLMHAFIGQESSQRVPGGEPHQLLNSFIFKPCLGKRAGIGIAPNACISSRITDPYSNFLFHDIAGTPSFSPMLAPNQSGTFVEPARRLGAMRR